MMVHVGSVLCLLSHKDKIIRTHSLSRMPRDNIISRKPFIEDMTIR